MEQVSILRRYLSIQFCSTARDAVREVKSVWRWKMNSKLKAFTTPGERDLAVRKGVGRGPKYS